MSVLRDAYEIIKDPDKWTHGSFAVDGDGVNASPLDPDAERYCAQGAIYCAMGTEYWEDSDPLHSGPMGTLEAAAKQLFPALDAELTAEAAAEAHADQAWRLVAVNDRLGHEAVVQVFEKALVNEEGSL